MEHSNILTFKHSNIVITLVMTILASASWAATYYASPDGASDASCLSASTAGSLDRAVALATASGDVIQLATGTYPVKTSSVTLNVEGITLQGASDDASETVLEGPGTAKAFTGLVIKKKAVVKNLTLTKFYVTGGGAAVAGGNVSWTLASGLTAVNCRIVGNSSSAPAVYGGTWHNCFFSSNTNTSSTGSAGRYGNYYGCVFTNNYANGAGGVLSHNAMASNCLFVANRAADYGGAVISCVSIDCVFYTNRAAKGGAGGDGTYRGCVFTNNVATGNNGGALFWSNDTGMVASNCVFYGNVSILGNGGAVAHGTYRDCSFLYNRSLANNGGAVDSAILYGCYFEGNVAKQYAGAAQYGISYDCVFSGNKAATGGAVIGATLYRCVLTNNFASSGAGGAFSTTTYDCMFVDNTSSGSGGGGARGTHNNGVFIRNKANASNGYGGALSGGTANGCVFEGNLAYCGGSTSDTTVNNSVFMNSYTDVFVHGLALSGGTVKNSLIKGFHADAANVGIVRSATSINCTIVSNYTETASYGAVMNGTTKNCIIMDNSRDISGGTHYNALYGVITGSPTLNNCIQRTDAKFNAGRDPSLPYYYLRQGSPARNAGIDVGWTAESLDLRGEKRLVGAVDLGCYEYQPVGFSFIVR